MASESEDGSWLYGPELDDFLQSAEKRREELIKEFWDESPAGFAWWKGSFQHFRAPASEAENSRGSDSGPSIKTP